MNFELERTNMVQQQVRPWHVLNESVLHVLSQIPRELFVPPEYCTLAYSDIDIPLGNGQTMLSPKVVGRALQALALSSQAKVLEIGTGTGYVTACLAKLAKTVISIEINPTLLLQAEKQLQTLHLHNLTLIEGNGAQGWNEYAPYDAIIATGSYPQKAALKPLYPMLKPQGRLFAVCGQPPIMEALLIERKNEQFCTTSLFETFVPALTHCSQPETFLF